MSHKLKQNMLSKLTDHYMIQFTFIYLHSYCNRTTYTTELPLNPQRPKQNFLQPSPETSTPRLIWSGRLILVSKFHTVKGKKPKENLKKRLF